MTTAPSSPVDFTTIDTKTGKQTKVATITDYGDDDNGPTVLYTKAANAATAAGVDLAKVAAKPSVDPKLLYSEPRFNIEQQATKIEDYLRGTAIEDALYEAQGFEKPYTGLYVAEDRPMTEAELQKYKPLIDMADDIMNENITVEELGDMDREDQEAFLRAIGVQGLGPAKRESSFTGGDFDVASSEEEFVRDLLNQGLSKRDAAYWDKLGDFREKKKEEVEIPGTAYLMDKPEMPLAPSEEIPPTIDTKPPTSGLMSRKLLDGKDGDLSESYTELEMDSYLDAFIPEMEALEGLGGDTVLQDLEPTYAYGITEAKANEYGLEPNQFDTMEDFARAFAARYRKEKEEAYPEIFTEDLDKNVELGLQSYLWNTGQFYTGQLRELREGDMLGFIEQLKDVINTRDRDNNNQRRSMSGLSKRRAAEANIIGRSIEGYVPIATVETAGTRESPIFIWKDAQGNELYREVARRPLHSMSSLGSIAVPL
jgi:GH24 family phage-related lysozyme (muramidase)